MAGIGFRLLKLLNQESYLSTMQAYLYSALISSGPWLVTIIVLGLINVVQSHDPGAAADTTRFRLTIVYCYAFSLILVGIIQMPLTRYLADLLYSRDLQMYLPTFVSAAAIVGTIQALVGIAAVVWLSDWSLLYRSHAVILYVAVSITWVAMIFISTVQDYHSVSFSFVFGAVVSLGGAYWLGPKFGAEGYLTGYTVGQVFICLMLVLRVAVEFPSHLPVSFDWLRYLRRFPSLVIIGFSYNLAIWIDKFIFWFGPVGYRADAFLHSCELYDTPMFLAYLTVVPAMSLFLIRIETSFYRSYQGFYSAIVNKKSLRAIRQQKASMVSSIRLSMARLIKLQGSISLVTVLITPYLVGLLPLTWMHVSVMRAGTLGAFLHSLFLLLSIGLLYFEFRTETVYLTLLFLIANGLFSWATIGFGVAYYGYGYLAACYLSLVVGLVVLDYKLRNPEYITFAGQPIG